MSTVNIHGHEIEISPPAQGCVITDIIILSRSVHVDDQDDDIEIATTNNTTGIVTTGILRAAQVHNDAQWSATTIYYEGDEDDD